MFHGTFPSGRREAVVNSAFVLKNLRLARAWRGSVRPIRRTAASPLVEKYDREWRLPV